MPDPLVPPDGAATPAPAQTEPIPVNPPDTRTPVQFNQQINVQQQIPPSVWNKFSPNEALEALKLILEQAERNEQRQFDYAMDQAKKQSDDDTRRIRFGSVVVIVIYGVSAALAYFGHGIVGGILASTITGSLITIFGAHLSQ